MGPAMKENKLCTHPLPGKICSFSAINLSWKPEENFTSVRNRNQRGRKNMLFWRRKHLEFKALVLFCLFCWFLSNGVLDLVMPCIVFHRMRQQREKVRMGHLLLALALVRELVSDMESHCYPRYALG